ncbi:MAG: helix-turn-helix domain-containing protein [Spirochaetes bacterium]|nr:helix-turn-helix domain-containing protein [Spirochaetota bacterium]
MEKKINLNQNLENKLILSPSLVLSMNILNLNNIELYQFLKEKEEENPFIEVLENKNLLYEDLKKNREKENLDEINFEEFEFIKAKYSNKRKEISTTDIIEDLLKNEETIIDKIEDYLNYFEIDNDDKNIIISFLFYLNSYGIFIKKEKEIINDLEIDKFKFENLRMVLQTIENKGIGSLNLKELFLVQIHLKGDSLSDIYYDFINENWDDFINLRLSVLEKKGYTKDFINNIIENLKNIVDLDVLSEFKGINSNYIVPDIVVNYDGSDFNIKINSYFKLKNHNYDKLKSFVFNEELKDKYKEYENIKNSINLREEIIKNFIEYFVLYQQEFLKKGIKYIKMISQKEFADKIGVSYSTLSRIVSNKYIQTDFGIFPLKFFFQTVKNKKNKNSIEYSKKDIIENIKNIIENEGERPLSDIEISQKLKEKGLNIARRTVSKYRSELGILPANLRKIKK